MAEAPPILVIEDDPTFGATVAAALRDRGFEVEIAFDGLAGLGRMRTSPTPRAVLLDLVIPGVDGYAVFQELRENRHFPAVPVIVVSGSSLIDVDMLSGAERVLAKPRGDAALRQFLDEITSLLATVTGTSSPRPGS